MIKKLPVIILIISIICLISAVTTLVIGSNKSRIFNQMNNTKAAFSISDIKGYGEKPFLLSGVVEKNHNTLQGSLLTYERVVDGESKGIESQELTITLDDGSVKLMDGYGIADFNKVLTRENDILRGIKAGSEITIYSVSYKEIDELVIKGYNLYPGNPGQYTNFLSSPFNTYMVYVRVLIGLALIFFLLSIVLNIKK